MLMRSVSSKNRGFTLTETAIAVLIGATLLAALWVLVDRAFESEKLYRATRQLMDLVEGVRANYGTDLYLSGAATSVAFTQQVAQRKAFPPDMLRTSGIAIENCGTGLVTCTFGLPWPQSTVTLDALKADGTVATSVADQSQAFRVYLAGLSQRACVGIVSHLIGQEKDLYIRRDATTGNSQISLNNGNGSGAVLLTPAELSSVDNMNARCAATGNTLQLDFLLR